MNRPCLGQNSGARIESLLAALKMGVHLMRQGDFITDYEVKLGGKIAQVLCGGDVTPGTPVSEQYILDLEREGFKSLCGETQDTGTDSIHIEDRQDAEELIRKIECSERSK